VTKRLKVWLAASAAGVVALGVAGGVSLYVACERYDASVDRTYEVPVPKVERSRDPEVLARGKHLVESVGACAMEVCHGADLGGGLALEMGPLGTLAAPNLTAGGVVAKAYSDGELVRLVKHGLKRDGRSVELMPSEELGWLPESDVMAMVSYVRSVPAVDRVDRGTATPFPEKLLDRLYDLPVDVARRIDHTLVEDVPAPAPTAAYGAFLARPCRLCHGPHFSGGRIPGLPPSMTTPLDLTADPTGLAGWTFEDFDRTMRHGVRKNGTSLSVFMPIDAWKNLDDVEMHALWAYLEQLPARPFGQR
jgi:cytochrome c553